MRKGGEGEGKRRGRDGLQFRLECKRRSTHSQLGQPSYLLSHG